MTSRNYGGRPQTRRSGPGTAKVDYRDPSKRPGAHKTDSSGERLVLGQQCVREVVKVFGARTYRIVFQEKPSPRLEALKRFATDQGISVQEVSRSELDRLAGGSLHQGVAAFAPPLTFTDFADILLNPTLIAIALDGVVDPQNFGAVVRSAVGVAGAPIIWSESASAPLTPATFRASAGAIEHATLCRVASLHGTLQEAAEAGVSIYGLAPDATELLHEVNVDRPTIVVIGSEEKGMGKNVRQCLTGTVRLHQTGTIQSLNASVAAGIALHTIAVKRSIIK